MRVAGLDSVVFKRYCVMSLASRLAALSQQALIELVVAGCEQLPALKNRADALTAEVKPLPTWCVDEVLLSPDLLPSIMSTLSLQECDAAVACSSWAAAYATHISRLRILLPNIQRTIEAPPKPVGQNGDVDDAEGGLGGMCMLPGDVLAISSSQDDTISFEAARELTDPHRLSECRLSPLASALASRDAPVRGLMGMAITDDSSLLVCEFDEYLVVRVTQDGVMTDVQLQMHPYEVVAHWPSRRAFVRGRDRMSILDATTLDYIHDIVYDDIFGDDNENDVRGIAVHEDTVIISHDDQLSVLDLDGKFLRTIQTDVVQPQSLAAADGRIYLTEQPIDGDVDESHAKRLLVIDIETGQIVQTVTPWALDNDEVVNLSQVMVDGNEIYLGDYYGNKVHVLRFAGTAVS